MPAHIRPDQHKYLVQLDPALARRLEHFRVKRAGGAPRLQVIRKAIQEYIDGPSRAAGMDEDVRRELDRFCKEGDGAVEAQVISNALRMYVPQRRWALAAERQPEMLSPALRGELRPAVAEQAQRFCTRTGVPSRWFLEHALQAQIARGEQDQWQRFLLSVPPHLVGAMERSGTDAAMLVVRSLTTYLRARLDAEPELAAHMAASRAEAAAQMTLFAQPREAQS